MIDVHPQSASSPVRSVLDAARDGAVFFSDRKGDLGNIEYGGNNKSSVPFYRTNDRYMLGAERGAHHAGSSPLASLTRKEVALLWRSTGYVADAAAEKPILGVDRADHAPVLCDDDADFVSLKDSRVKKHEQIDPGHEESQSPRSHSSSLSESGEESTVKEEGDQTIDHDSASQAARAENARLAGVVKQEPQSAEAWHQYIEFQEVWLGGGFQSDAQSLSTRGVADVKLSMYSKAIKSVKDNDPKLEILLCDMMREAEKVLEAQKLEKRWQEAIKGHRHFSKLWLAYLDFMQSSSASFQLTTYQDMVKECLSILTGAWKAKQPAQDIVDLVYLFLRYSCCMRDAGYYELATGLWQAVFELNFPIPSRRPLTGNAQERIDELEEFWDGEESRCGEYAISFGQKEVPAAAQPLSDSFANAQNSERPDASMERFAKEETGRARRSQRPARASDDADSDDPFRVVLFSDLKPFLFLVPDGFRRVLVNAFLCFYGLPPLLDTDTTVDDIQYWWQDSFLNQGWDCNIARAQPDSVPQDPTILNSRTTIEALFAKSQALPGSLVFPSLRSISDVSFVTNTLTYLTAHGPLDTSLLVYLIAFTHHTSPTSARSLAKAFLKKDPNNVPIYLALSHLEFADSNPSRAILILSTTIANFAASQHLAILPLWRTWLFHALQTGDRDAARRIALSIGRAEVLPASPNLSPTDYLPAVLTTLQAALTSPTTPSNPSQHADILDLLALITYLFPSTPSNSLSDALDSYTTSLASLPSQTSPTAHLLHQHRATLITNHTAAHLPHDPHHTRATLAQSTALFPGNTALLAAHDRQQSRLRIDVDALRARRTAVAATSTTSLSHTSPVNTPTPANCTAPAWRIATELHRFSTQTQPHAGSAHPVRAAFERALRNDRAGAPHCAAIWRAYCAFELALPAPAPAPSPPHARKGVTNTAAKVDEERPNNARAKAIWLRAVRALPWHKDLAVWGLLRAEEMGVSDGEGRAVIDGGLGRGWRVLVGEGW